MDTYHAAPAGNHQFVPLTEHHIFVAARMGQGFIQVDSDAVRFLQRLAGADVTGIYTGFNNLHHVLALPALFFGHHTDEARAGLVGEGCNAARLQKQIRHMFLTAGKGIFPGEVHLSRHLKVPLDIVGRTLVNGDFVVGFQHKITVAVVGQALIQGEAVQHANVRRGGHAVRILLATGYVHAGCGGAVQQTARHDDEVLDGGVFRERIFARILHHAGDSHGALFLEVIVAGDVNFVVVLQGKVRTVAGKDFRQVQGEYLHAAVLMLAVYHHAVRKGFRKQSAGLLDELLGRMHVLTQFIGPREIHGALHRDTVLIQGL